VSVGRASSGGGSRKRSALAERSALEMDGGLEDLRGTGTSAPPSIGLARLVVDCRSDPVRCQGANLLPMFVAGGLSGSLHHHGRE